MRLKIPLLSFIISIACLVGCDYGFKELTPTYAIPLVNSKLSVYNLLAKVDSSIIRGDQDGIVTLVYQQDIIEVPFSSLVLLPNQSQNADAVYPGPSINPFPNLQQAQYSGSFDLNFISPTIEELYRLLLETGQMKLVMSSSIEHKIDYTVNFPGITKSGASLSISGTSSTGGNHNQTKTENIDGYNLDLSKGNSSHNKITVNYSIVITSFGSSILSAGEKVNFSLSLEDLNFDSMEGYFGKIVLPELADSIPIRLFQFTNEQATNTGESFALTDPRIKLQFSNNMVLPVQLTIKELKLKKLPSGSTNDILLSGFQNPFSIQYPLVPDQVEVTTMLIDRTNSNIKELMTPTDKELIFKVEAAINPNQKSVNAITKNGKLGIGAQLELPMVGYGGNWVLGDTVQLGLSLGDQQELKSGLIRLNLENSFPIDIFLQLYFLDENKVVLDSLFTNDLELLKAGVIDANGRVLNTSKTIKDIGADQAKMKVISSAKYVAITSRIQTANFQNKQEIKLYTDNFISVKIGVKAEIGVQF